MKIPRACPGWMVAIMLLMVGLVPPGAMAQPPDAPPPVHSPTDLRVSAALNKPTLEICLNASDAAAARRFFKDGLGFTTRPEAKGMRGGGMRMLMFEAGSSGSVIKVRVYQTPPAKRPVELAAAGGIRVVTLRIQNVDEVVARLRGLGFEATDAQYMGGVAGMRWSLVRDGDGTAFELVEAAAERGQKAPIEIGLVVRDLAAAKAFFTGMYGARELPVHDGADRLFPGRPMARFTTREGSGTIFNLWSPAEGGAASPAEDAGKIADALGFRYITHSIRDTAALHDAMKAAKAKIDTPLSAFGDTASLFMVRGPGGTIFEFVGPPMKDSKLPTATSENEKPPAAAIPSQVRDMFQRVDRDGDGVLIPREMPNAERFKQMDADGDGKVTIEEAAKSFTGAPGPNVPGGGGPGDGTTPIPPSGPEAAPPKDGPFLDLVFTTDFHASRMPEGSPLRDATEANVLVPHNGMLYCATSYMPESGKLGDVNPKVLVKRSATAAWEVDFEAGSDFMRLGFMRSVAFTTDAQGKKLPKPVSVLVAGTGAWRSQPTGVVVFSRNDGTDKWVRTELSPDRWNRAKLNHTTEVRCIFDHVDRVTGVHMVFAGSATGRIYRGVYDPSEPGLIKWDKTPEIEGLLGHVLCAAEANGVQYVGIAYGATEKDIRQDPDRPVKDHGLFRRVDGPSPRWEWVPIKAWEDPQRPGRSLRTAQLRGMTAVPAAEGKGEELLIAWDTRDAAIERIDPRNGYTVDVELEVRSFIRSAWGRNVGVSTFAYNNMQPATDPHTGKAVHLIGLWLLDPRGEADDVGKSSWYLVRSGPGQYSYQRIWDRNNPLEGQRYGLRGCRSIVASPFPEEAGRVWYFCGFDQTGATGRDGAKGPMAWIYRGSSLSADIKESR